MTAVSCRLRCALPLRCRRRILDATQRVADASSDYDKSLYNVVEKCTARRSEACELRLAPSFNQVGGRRSH